MTSLPGQTEGGSAEVRSCQLTLCSLRTWAQSPEGPSAHGRAVHSATLLPAGAPGRSLRRLHTGMPAAQPAVGQPTPLGRWKRGPPAHHTAEGERAEAELPRDLPRAARPCPALPPSLQSSPGSS